MSSKSVVRKDGRLSINGTSLKGYLDISYADLVRLFGEPNRGASGDQKVLVEWVLRTPAGVATIYNYKDGVNYVRGGLEAKDIRDWHIGGRDSGVVLALAGHIGSSGLTSDWNARGANDSTWFFNRKVVSDGYDPAREARHRKGL